MNDKALAEAIITGLSGRKGFDAWWDELDEDIKEEIYNEICNAILDAIKQQVKDSLMITALSRDGDASWAVWEKAIDQYVALSREH